MHLDTHIFDPSPCGFPKPRVPLLPTGFDGVGFHTNPLWAPAKHFRHFTHGRYALHEAYRLSGIGPGSVLFAPAYHCRTMVDPALVLGSGVILYPLTPELSPDLDAIATLAKCCQVPPKALLATHFFGIAKPFDQLAAWCQAQGITLVEDCSHAFFTEQHRPLGIGHYGDFVVSSPYKFLPSPDGGLLYSHDASRLKYLSTRNPPFLNELRGIHIAWTKANEQRRNRAAQDPTRLDAELDAIKKSSLTPGTTRDEFAGASADYESNHELLAGLRVSRTIYSHPDIDAIASLRRKHYRRWAVMSMNLPYCRPLYPELPNESIPYMFPLLIEYPEPHFYWLKQLGVPIFRWDSIVASNCPIANNYRLRLLHLPCHQSLTTDELDWMIAALHKVAAVKTIPN